MYDLKNKKMFTATAIGLLILFLSGFGEYFYYFDEGLMTFEVKGFSLTLLFVIIILYGFKVKNEPIRIIATLLSFIGYAYTFYNSFPIIFSSDFKKFGMSIGIGFYGHLLSLLIIIISLFLKDKNSIKDSTVQEDPIIDESYFVIGHLLLGLKGIPYGKLSILKNDIDNKVVCIEYKDEYNNILTKKIAYSSIRSIDVKKSVVMQEKQSFINKTDYEEANLLLSALLSSNAIGQLAMNGILNSFIDSYSKTSSKTLYTIEIKFMEENEEKRVLIELLKNPNEFVEKLNENHKSII